jgi:hypothetical protein
MGAVFARDLPGLVAMMPRKRPIPAEIACPCDSGTMSTIHAQAGDAADEKLHPGSAADPG